jgi:hypothetical protein
MKILLGCDTVWSDRCIPMIWSDVLPPSSGKLSMEELVRMYWVWYQLLSYLEYGDSTFI